MLCDRCRPALEVRLALSPGSPIGLPGDVPDPLVQVDWCAPFDGAVRTALHALKYSGERRLAVPLGEAAAARWRAAGAGGDLVVPVPVHTVRARERGYDQAVLLATVIADALSLPMARLLERHRRTIAQFELDRAQRATNVTGAFRLRDQGGRGTTDPEGRWVILVDDVMTTGSTLAACGHVLLETGALAVSGLTVAREW